MKKLKFLLITVAAVACVFALGMVASNAETYGELTYSVENGEVTITGCNETVSEVIIPAEIDGYPVTRIGEKAFYYCINFNSITIPEGVTSIGDYAFYRCDLRTQEITIPDSVKTIGAHAFEECYLQELTIGNGVETIGDYAFYGSVEFFEKDLKIPDSVKTIGAYAFADCTIYSLTIGNSVETIGNYAFYYSCFDETETTLTIPDSVVTIGDYAFSRNSLYDAHIIIGKGIKAIGDYAFADTGIEWVKILGDVRSIGIHALDDTGISLHTISATADENGIVDAPNAMISGNNAIINVKPKFGYMIDRVTLDGADVTAAFDVYNGGTYTVYNVRKNVAFAATFKEVEVNEESGITTTDAATFPSVFVPAKNEGGNGHHEKVTTFGKIKKGIQDILEYGVELLTDDGREVKSKSGMGPRFKAKKSSNDGYYGVAFGDMPAGKYKVRTYIKYTDGRIGYGAATKFEIK